MKRFNFSYGALFGLILILGSCKNEPVNYMNESKEAKDTRMEWWRDARFGMFIHWGLYSVPAGEWNGETNHGEWIRTTAEIPLDEYDKFRDQFNPVNFDAKAWVRMAKDAGMKYIVITSKHHDGFCLFDSEETDFDVMSTPFKRDILKELSDACKAEGIKICWYHSIMDWHHPDYFPRRGWETDRTTEGADLNRYITYMKAQLKELTGNYGKIGVLWLDGEWEETWTHEYGVDLYNYVRNLQPDIIINNRVDNGRSGMAGMTREGGYAGDFGTPEQEIPATGMPGMDWETCMTMNDHWGFNKYNDNWKSTADLIRKLADIASKGGNFLLNVGPKADGTFPEESINRLREIGDWMDKNSEAIYETSSSPFQKLDWGRCTQKQTSDGTRLYLHVFNWTKDAILKVPGIFNEPKSAFLLAENSKAPLNVTRHEDALWIALPEKAPDTINTVVVLDIVGKPDISYPPVIQSDYRIFTDKVEPVLISANYNFEIRYTTDGSIPSIESPKYSGTLTLNETTLLTARSFRDGKPVSESVCASFTKVKPWQALKTGDPKPGIQFSYYEGDWDSLPDFAQMTPLKTGITNNFNLSEKINGDYYGFVYDGFIQVSQDGIYGFMTDSDDGSQLFIDGNLVVDNDGLHGMVKVMGAIALAKGYHSIKVTFFEKGGQDDLKVFIKEPGMNEEIISEEILFHRAPDVPKSSDQ
jgi:alpha-L-fucosidase